MKVQLIYPDSDYNSEYNQITPPLAILSIATFIQRNLEGINIEILDGSLEKIVPRVLNADITGISCYSYNYRNGLRIARISKDHGSKVILGGPHSTYFTKLILKKRDYIDGIIVGQGERSFCKFIKAYMRKGSLSKIEAIEGLYTRDKKIPKNIEREKSIDINEIPIFNYNLVNLIKYWEETKKRSLKLAPKSKFIYKNHSLLSSFISHYGCGLRLKGKRCIFCSILTYNNSRLKPNMYWEYIIKQKQKYNADLIRDFGDDFSQNLRWLKEISEKKPSDIDVSIIAYSRADTINEEVVNEFKKIGVKFLHIGLESGSDTILKKDNKNLSIRQSLNALEILNNYEIYVIPSFVIGSLGESRKSIKRTIKFIERIKEYNNVLDIQLPLLVPVPGSKAYEMLDLSKIMDYEYDIIPLTLLQKKWFESYCDITYEDAKNINEEYSSGIKWC